MATYLLAREIAYRGYLIRAYRDRGFTILHGAHCIQRYVASVADAKAIIDLLA
jgi:hypothetical protein